MSPIEAKLRSQRAEQPPAAAKITSKQILLQQLKTVYKVPSKTVWYYYPPTMSWQTKIGQVITKIDWT